MSTNKPLIEGDTRLTTITHHDRTINLHANRLQSFGPLPQPLSGLAPDSSPSPSLLPRLVTLNLSSNALRGFRCPACPLPNLRHFDLSANRLETLQGFPSLPQLRVLLLPFNLLRDLQGLPALPGECAPSLPAMSFTVIHHQFFFPSFLSFTPSINQSQFVQFQPPLHPNNRAPRPGCTGQHAIRVSAPAPGVFTGRAAPPPGAELAGAFSHPMDGWCGMDGFGSLANRVGALTHIHRSRSTPSLQHHMHSNSTHPPAPAPASRRPTPSAAAPATPRRPRPSFGV